MTEQPLPDPLPPALGAKHESPTRTEANLLPLQADSDKTAEALGVPPPVSQLTPEEQMALFEKELKEKDWGHQPC